jgi:HD-GYP domain-containing protein (c-di-GMP phosphodiesterase class II)
MTADRPFRSAVSEDYARKHLTELAAIEFDPQVVLKFLSIQEQTDA